MVHRCIDSTFTLSFDRLRTEVRTGLGLGLLLLGPSWLAALTGPAPGQSIGESEPVLLGGAGMNLEIETSFPAADAETCCPGPGGSSPSQPDIAVGPNHVVVTTVRSVEVFSTDGEPLLSTDLPGLFFGAPPCQNHSFPEALYDERSDRFVVGASAGDFYCMAVTATSDPTATWYGYVFPFAEGYWELMRAGIGTEAIFMAGIDLSAGRPAVFAFDKEEMYAGDPASWVQKEIRSTTDFPVPLHLHGWRDGSWPEGDQHYFLLIPSVDSPSDLGIISWTDPFGSNILSLQTNLDLEALHGISLSPPLDNPQAGGTGPISGGDSRLTDFEYRHGYGWTVNHAACDQNGLPMNCLQWAKIELATRTAIEAGVFGSEDSSRAYGDLAVDACGNVALGYTRFSPSEFPSTAVAGRLATDAPGTLRPEILVQPGETPYRNPNRWGESTGMTIDPAGTTFWYAGIYSKDLPPAVHWNWATSVTAASFPSCKPLFADGFESGTLSAWNSNP